MVYYGWRKSKKKKSLGVSKPKDINMMFTLAEGNLKK